MATGEQQSSLPLEVRGPSAKAIAAGETRPIRGHSAKAIAAAEAAQTGIPGQADWPRGLDPSVTNADTFVPNQIWEPPPRRRREGVFGFDQSGLGFDQGTFDAGTFDGGFVTPASSFPVESHNGAQFEVRAAGTIGGAAVRGLAGGEAEVRTVVGTTRFANRDAILIKSTTVRLLLTAAIDRARAERSNSAGVPELEAILAAANDLHEMVSLTPTISAGEVDAKVVTFKEGVLNWWDRDHVEIVSNTFNAGLFATLVELCAEVDLVKVVAIATILKGKDMVEALKALAKIVRGDE